ncbi:MAG: amidase [Methyloligellaceae bacterium]
MSADLRGLTIEDAVEGVRTKAFRVEELAQASLDGLDTIGRELNAVARLESGHALAEAARLDREIADGKTDAPLLGAPLAHKDLYFRKGWCLEAGSTILAGNVAGETAAACARLDAAGALDIARLNTVEFALGTTGHNAITGHVRNPWNPDYITGGSSSGSGASVAAGLVPAALGSDTGGSIRLPAAACGLVGLKPTFGRVGRSGVFPLSHSLDTVGPLTRTVRDTALVLQAIAGHDPDDAGSVDHPVPDYMAEIEDGVQGLRIGVPENHFFDPVTPDVASGLDEARRTLGALGAEFQSVTFDQIVGTNRLTTLIICVEGAAVHGAWLREQASEYSDQTLSRLMSGLFIPGETYVRALDFRRRFARLILETVFDAVDLVFVPVWPYQLPTIAESDLGANPGFSDMVGASGHCTRPVNLLGFPSISVPCGFTPNGLPAAFQLIARPFEEALLLRAARAFERAVEFTEKRPPVSVWNRA